MAEALASRVVSLVLLLSACTGAPSDSVPDRTHPSTTTDTSISAGETGDTGVTTDPSGCVGAIPTFDAFPIAIAAPYRNYDVAHAFDDDGLWLAWNSEAPNFFGYTEPIIMAGRMGCDLAWTLAPTQVAGNPSESHLSPTVAVDAGAALIAWEVYHNRDGGGVIDVFAGIVDRAGGVVFAPDRMPITVGGELTVLESRMPTAVAHPDGGFYVAGAWEEADIWNAFLLQLDASGAPVGDAWTVLPGARSQNYPDVATTDPLTVAWHDIMNLPQQVVFATIDGATVTDERTEGNDFDIAAAPEGAWRAWSVLLTIRVQAPDGSITNLGTPGLFEDEPSIGVGDERVAVVWLRHDGGFGEQTIELASFDRSGNLLGEQRLQAGDGGLGGAVEVTHVGQDVFFVAWEEGTDFSSSSLYGQFVDLK